MRSLEQALQDHELIVLRVIGEWWELDLTGSDKTTCVKVLARGLAQLDLPQEVEYLPPEEAIALSELVAAGGRIPVAAFNREHGEIRAMGPARLEREEPWMDPVSTAEALWYRGLLYRGFDDTAEGVIEFFYLPDEFLAQFPRPAEERVIKEAAVLSLAPVAAPARFNAAVVDAVDDLTTLLALAQQTSLQAGYLDQLDNLLLNPDRHRRSLFITLAQEAGWTRQTEEGLRPTRAAVTWLKQSRESQLRTLCEAWSHSAWNDLCHTPGLVCEGENWQNDPILARKALLDALPRNDNWYRLDDLVTHLRETDPDFQRPDSNYDTWYIREVTGDAYITGFSNWDLVEGRLLRFLVEGPMFWLGLVETVTGEDERRFRLTSRALEWLAGNPPAQDEVRVPLVVQADARLIVPYNADRYHRFQAARISEAEAAATGKPFAYRLTPHSLAQAQAQGIPPDRIMPFLEEASGRPLPAGVRRALARWSERGVEGRLETVVILRARDAAIIETLRSNPKTRDYLGESLGELSVVVRPQNLRKLLSATAELGLLLDDSTAIL